VRVAVSFKNILIVRSIAAWYSGSNKNQQQPLLAQSLGVNVLLVYC